VKIFFDLDNEKIAIIGLGYVGLPLAVEFGKFRDVIGFDINTRRVNNLRTGFDETKELSHEELLLASNLIYSSDPEILRLCRIFIVTVPTPIDDAKRPDLLPLIRASELVGVSMPVGSVVIYESTVFPGLTEQVCVPALERVSGMKFNKDFFCGYSPERINPGDKEHRLINIKKITSGSTPDAAQAVDKLYKQIISAGTHLVSSIKVAEAAKVIENTQRDLNIALMNELSLIFHLLGIDTLEVLKAAETKWNFLSFRPGLVGGHCIGVDPYYLTYKANKIGHYPKLILSGRNINDQMPKYVFNEINKILLKSSDIKKKNVLIMGISFKNNIPDYRNSQAIKLYKLFKKFNNVDIYDPLVNRNKIFLDEKIKLIKEVKKNFYDSIIIAVNHNKIKKIGLKKIISYGKKNVLLFDILDLFNSKLNKWCL
jgi:UDP-N-acetyl-D-galactosamine dehydrogenase